MANKEGMSCYKLSVPAPVPWEINTKQIRKGDWIEVVELAAGGGFTADKSPLFNY